MEYLLVAYSRSSQQGTAFKSQSWSKSDSAKCKMENVRWNGRVPVDTE